MTPSTTPHARSFAERELDEAGQLAVFLDAQRFTLRQTAEGLSEEELRTRLVESKTTVLGLLKHVTFMQVVWYGEAVSGTPRTELGQPQDVDASFDLGPDDTATSVLAGFDRSCELGRAIATRLSPDEVVSGHPMGAMTLRWIQLQVLRELAQHNGHADILREQLLTRRRTARTDR